MQKITEIDFEKIVEMEFINSWIDERNAYRDTYRDQIIEDDNDEDWQD